MALSFNTTAELDIPTAGTAVRVSTAFTPIIGITFQAKPTNTGNIFVGDSLVSSTRGITLTPGSFVSIEVPASRPDGEYILSDFYVNAATSGDDVRVSYVKVR